MSYDEALIIDADQEDEITNDADVVSEYSEEDKLTNKQQKVNNRRRIEDILAEREYKKMYGDFFDEF